jgi:hypothetical protein
MFGGVPLVPSAAKEEWILMDCLTWNAINAVIHLSKARDAADRSHSQFRVNW